MAFKSGTLLNIDFFDLTNMIQGSNGLYLFNIHDLCKNYDYTIPKAMNCWCKHQNWIKDITIIIQNNSNKDDKNHILIINHETYTFLETFYSTHNRCEMIMNINGLINTANDCGNEYNKH